MDDLVHGWLGVCGSVHHKNQWLCRRLSLAFWRRRQRQTWLSAAMEEVCVCVCVCVLLLVVVVCVTVCARARIGAVGAGLCLCVCLYVCV